MDYRDSEASYTSKKDCTSTEGEAENSACEDDSVTSAGQFVLGRDSRDADQLQPILQEEDSDLVSGGCHTEETEVKSITTIEADAPGISKENLTTTTAEQNVLQPYTQEQNECYKCPKCGIGLNSSDKEEHMELHQQFDDPLLELEYNDSQAGHPSTSTSTQYPVGGSLLFKQDESIGYKEPPWTTFICILCEKAGKLETYDRLDDFNQHFKVHHGGVIDGEKFEADSIKYNPSTFLHSDNDDGKLPTVLPLVHPDTDCAKEGIELGSKGSTMLIDETFGSKENTTIINKKCTKSFTTVVPQPYNPKQIERCEYPSYDAGLNSPDRELHMDYHQQPETEQLIMESQQALSKHNMSPSLSKVPSIQNLNTAEFCLPSSSGEGPSSSSTRSMSEGSLFLLKQKESIGCEEPLSIDTEEHIRKLCGVCKSIHLSFDDLKRHMHGHGWNTNTSDLRVERRSSSTGLFHYDVYYLDEDCTEEKISPGSKGNTMPTDQTSSSKKSENITIEVRQNLPSLPSALKVTTLPSFPKVSFTSKKETDYNKKYPCDMCDMRFTLPEELWEHMLNCPPKKKDDERREGPSTTHPIPQNSPTTSKQNPRNVEQPLFPPATKKHQCIYCDLQVSSARGLRQHFLRNHKDCRIACTKCNGEFLGFHNLEDHQLLVHELLPLPTAPDAGHPDYQDSIIRSLRRTFFSFKCIICDQRFRTMEELSRHKQWLKHN